LKLKNEDVGKRAALLYLYYM